MEHADIEVMPLGRDALVAKVVAAVAASNADSTAARIYALLGPWGSGKSWILDRAVRKLRGDNKDATDPVVEFNPWLFGSDEAIGRGFATALVSKAGGTQKRRRAVAGAIDNYGPVVTPLLSRLGVDSSELGKRLSGRLSDVGSPAAIRAMLTKATKDRRLIVVMDDLDRLTPDELLMVFKLIRLVGDIPTITYLLAYDETTLLGQVAKSSIGGNSIERSRSYMEKVVERTFVVPPLSLANLDDLVIRPIVDFGTSLFPSWSESDQEVLVYRLRALFPAQVTTPRAAHRLLDSVRELTVELAPEVNYDDWCLTSYLRVFFPDAWSVIVKERRLMSGESNELLFADDSKLRKRAKDLGSRLEELLRTRPGGEDLLAAIGRAFEGWTYLLDESTSGHPNQRRAAISRSVGHPDFIDRYVWRSLPPGEISERLVREWLVEVSKGGPGEALVNQFNTEPGRTIEVAFRHINDDDVDVVAVLLFFEGIYSDINKRRSNRDVFGVSGSLRAQIGVAIPDLSAESLDRFLKQSPTPLQERVLLADVLSGTLLRNMPPGPVNDRVNVVRAQLADLLAESLIASSYSWDDELVVHQLLTLLRLEQERARLLIAEQVAAGAWDPIEIATLWVSIVNAAGESYLESLLLGQLRSVLGDGIAGSMVAAANTSILPTARDEDAPFHLPVSRENAILIAANGLRQLDLVAQHDEV